MADKVPFETRLRDSLILAKDKMVYYRGISSYSERGTLNEMRTHEIIAQVENRIYANVKPDFSSEEVIKTVKSESHKIISEKQEIKALLRDKHSVSGELLDRMTYQVQIYKATYGNTPQESEIIKMRDTIRSTSLEHKGSDPTVVAFAQDRVITKCLSDVNNKQTLPQEVQKITQAKEAAKALEVSLAQQKEMQRSFSIEM